MKIIDLLNNIAIGKAVPKKIKIGDEVCEYIKGVDYQNERGGFLLSNEPINIRFLNTEIEIIEEEKGIPDKINCWYNYDGTKEIIKIMLDELKDKFNEIIDYLQSKGDDK